MVLEEIISDKVLLEYFKRIGDLEFVKEDSSEVFNDVKRKIQHLNAYDENRIKDGYDIIFSNKDLAVSFNMDNECVTLPFFYAIKSKNEENSLLHITKVKSKDSTVYNRVFYGVHLPVEVEEFYVRLGNETIVGGIQFDKYTGTLVNLYILPEYRGCGFAKLLLKSSIVTDVKVMAYNLLGKHVLQKCGFLMTEKPLFYVRRNNIC